MIEPRTEEYLEKFLLVLSRIAAALERSYIESGTLPKETIRHHDRGVRDDAKAKRGSMLDMQPTSEVPPIKR